MKSPRKSLIHRIQKLRKKLYEDGKKRSLEIDQMKKETKIEVSK